MKLEVKKRPPLWAMEEDGKRETICLFFSVLGVDITPLID